MVSDINWSVIQMIKKLRNRLTLLFTLSTGVILTAVLVLSLAITNQQIIRNNKETFQNNFMTVTQKVLMNNEISHLWLAEMETKNHLIIHIEDGGQALWYKGSWPALTDRQILVERVKKRALEDNINSNIQPVSINEVQSKMYNIKGNKNDRYFGKVFIASTDDGYRSIIMLQYASDNLSATIKQKLLIVCFYLSGIVALYFVGRWIIGKSLKPVEENRKRQTEFIAAASHELKSPLAVIRANASALKIEPERAEHFTEGIDKECMRLSTLIEDMLLLAWADAKNWSVRKEIIDVDILLFETYDSFRPFYAENHKELTFEPQEELLPKIMGDPLRMKQILSVLLDNAVSYSKDKDTIILRAYEKKNQLLIEVEDHGVGIEQNMKKEIFERFYKGDKSRRDKNHYGLGLSIAKELIELQEGKISLKDTEGGGVTFIISLPIYKMKDA